MTLQDMIDHLGLTLLTEQKDFSTIIPSSGYSSDLLSCVMAGAKHQGVWLTLQSHVNIVAVAALLELSAVIITEGAAPDRATVTRANEQGVTLLSTSLSTYEVAGKLWDMGLQQS